MRSLAEKGLVVEGPSGIYGPTFKLTTLGLAWRERMLGRETRRGASSGSVEPRSGESPRREPALA